MSKIDNLKEKFIVDKISNYWRDKMIHYKEMLEIYKIFKVKAVMCDMQVVRLKDDYELDTEQKHEFANACEGYCFAESQYELAIDLKENDAVSINDVKDKENAQ